MGEIEWSSLSQTAAIWETLGYVGLNALLLLVSPPRFYAKRFLALGLALLYLVTMKQEVEKRTEEKRAARYGVSLNELLARQDLQPFVATKKGDVESWKTEPQKERVS